MDANRAAQRLRREAETPEARPIKPSFANTRFLNAVFGLIRVFAPSAQGIQLYAHVPLSLLHAHKFLHALRARCSRSLPCCATGNGLQTASLAACSGSPHNAHIHLVILISRMSICE